ncbi:Hus1-like protein [Wilcoxina mikolae CBS 423.85]|nr:Hus1-like protein [Wilcoxina mikolae CBS 423.85]
MRFKTSVRNISTFTKLAQSLSSIGKSAWLRLSEDEVRFVIQAPEGTQVWASPTLFDDYRISSANSNIINLEVPLSQLHRALRSCASASDAVLRLTKRSSDGVPILCLTITTASTSNFLSASTLVTQEIPVRVLSATSVDTIVEPQAPDADVHIYLPSLSQVRGITERFNKLATFSLSPDSHKLVLSANMSGEFKLALAGGEVKVESKWRDLQNPLLADTEAREGHPSTVRNPTAFAEVRVDGREWAKVLRVGGLAKRVVACVCEGLVLVLYVFLTEEGDPDQTVVTYYISSYSV